MDGERVVWCADVEEDKGGWPSDGLVIGERAIR